MHIIDAINTKVSELVALGMTDEARVRRALTLAITQYPDRNPEVILQQQATLMTIQFHGGDTKYVKGE